MNIHSSYLQQQFLSLPPAPKAKRNNKKKTIRPKEINIGSIAESDQLRASNVLRITQGQ